MLCHYTLGFPADFRPPQGKFKLRYSRHAIEEAARDRHADLSAVIPPFIDTSKSQLVEVLFDKLRQPRKMVYRTPSEWGLDLVLTVYVDAYPWRVATVWANRRDDQHRTLDARRYDRP